MKRYICIVLCFLLLVIIISSCVQEANDSILDEEKKEEIENLTYNEADGNEDEKAPEGYCLMYRARNYLYEFGTINAVNLKWCGVISEPIYEAKNVRYVFVAVCITDIYGATFSDYFYRHGGERPISEIEDFSSIGVDYSDFISKENVVTNNDGYAVILFPENYAEKYTFGSELLVFLDLFEGIALYGESKNCFGVEIDRIACEPSVFEFDENGCLIVNENDYSRNIDTGEHLMRIMDLIVPTNIAFSERNAPLPIFENGITKDNIKSFFENGKIEANYVEKIYVKENDVDIFKALGWCPENTEFIE